MPEAADDDAIDGDALLALREMDDGDGRILRELAWLFLAGASQRMAALRAAARDGAAAEVQRLAQGFQAACAHVGARRMIAACAHVAAEAAAGRETSEGLDELEIELGRVRRELPSRAGLPTS